MATPRNRIFAPEYCFVLGSGCCGSSLVQEILARHSGMGFLSNIDDHIQLPARTSRANGPLYRHVPQSWTRKGRVRLAPSECYRALARQVSPLLAFPGRPLTADDAEPWLTERFRQFFTQRAVAQGKPVFLHKFTGHCRAGLVEAALPGTRYVHIVRDGRAVANSLMKQSWWVGEHGQSRSWATDGLEPEDRQAWLESGRSEALLAGLAWRTMLDEHARARKGMADDQWLVIRYEDVLADPLEQFSVILAHVGLQMDDGFRAVIDSYQLHTARMDGFRTELSSRSIALLDRHLGRSLAAMDYAVGSRAGAPDSDTEAS